MTGAALAHVRQRRLDNRDGAENVDFELRSDLLKSDLLYGAFQTVAGIIDEDVNAAGLFLRFFNAAMHARLVGHIEKDTDGLTGSELFEFRLCCFISDRARNRIAFGQHRLAFHFGNVAF